jgi:hypothetical protein
VYNYLSPETVSLSENMHSKKLFLTNFDNAVKRKIIVDSKKVFFPNRFGSRHQHFGIFPSFRDDIESLVYLLLYFFLEGNFLTQDTLEEMKIFKLGFVVETLYPRVPEEVVVLYNYATKIGFDEQPAMPFILNLFLKYFARNELIIQTLKYDWTERFEGEERMRQEVQEESGGDDLPARRTLLLSQQPGGS